MQPSDFSGEKTGSLVETQGSPAFLPASLPPQLVWNEELATALADASKWLGALGGVGSTLTTPSLLIRPFTNREALLSSKIEGTISTMAKLLQLQVVQAQRENVVRAKSETQEVDNYRRALEHGLESHLRVSRSLFREMHQILMEGTQDSQYSGDFRATQNWIGAPDCPIELAKFVPPPPLQMNDALEELERFIHADQPAINPLIRLAMIHYQFETIHPFHDGNGRIGRLLIPILLCRWKLLTHPLLYVSAYFEKRREEYYRRLFEVSTAGRWNEWVVFFLNGVATQARSATECAKALMDLRENYRQRFSSGSVKPFALIDDLFSIPATTVPAVTRLLDVTARTASLTVARLVDAKILTPDLRGSAHPRWYFAQEIIDLLGRG